MNILLGLAPFIVFFVLMRLVSPLAGLAAALAVSFLLCLHQWWRGERVKVLEVGSLLLFGVLVLYDSSPSLVSGDGTACGRRWSLYHCAGVTRDRHAVHLTIRA